VESDNLAKAICSAITQAYESSCPLKCYRGKKSAPWWNPELTKLRKNARKLQRRMDRVKDDHNLELYRAAMHSYKREIKRAKKESWRSYCQVIEGERPTARFVKMLSLDKMAKLNTLKKQDGTFTQNANETLHTLFDNFFPGGEPADPPAQYHSCDASRLAVSVVKESLIVKAVKLFKPYKAPGTDGIFPVLIQRAVRNPKFLRTLCRLCWGSFRRSFPIVPNTTGHRRVSIFGRGWNSYI